MRSGAEVGAGYAAANFGFSTPVSNTLPETDIRCISPRVRVRPLHGHVWLQTACHGNAPRVEPRGMAAACHQRRGSLMEQMAEYVIGCLTDLP